MERKTTKRTTKKYTHMTAQEFNNIRLLFEAGLSINKVIQVTGRSSFTCNVIKSVETFEDYQQYLRDLQEKRKAKLESQKPVEEAEKAVEEISEKELEEEGVAVEATDRMVALLQSMDKALWAIHRDNERMLELLEAQANKKRGLFS